MAGMNDCMSKVELRVGCSKLMDRDVTSKSDPCCVLLVQDNAGHWHEHSRTEQIKNSLNPKFATPLVINYYFERVQNLRFAVYDVDNATTTLKDDDFLGQADITLGHVVSNSKFSKALVNQSGKTYNSGHSIITIVAEEISGGNDSVQMTFRGRKLDKKDLLGKSDPFLAISKTGADGNWYPVAKTEVVKNNLDPSWRPMEISVQALCAGNYDRPIKIDCSDWDSDGSHDLIGSFTTTLSEMMKAVDHEVEFKAVNPKKAAKKKSYDNSGIICLSGIKIVKNYSFLDFIFGGLQINFTVGIDFTGSNGNPKQPSSLHYINPYQPNEYMAAIQSVGQVCQDYDSDKMFPALGFGAKIPTGEVSHEFAINFNSNNPFCSGIVGILEAYRNCVQQVELWGPTNFSPLIYHVSQFALAAQSDPSKQAYYILLIITDGAITDIDKTREAIVYASGLPMSIIIVGVGDADFTTMNILDGDNGILRAPNGQPVQRDIVQFVPFRQFVMSGPEVLAQQVLAEVPKQVTDYFKKRGVVPNPPRTA